MTNLARIAGRDPNLRASDVDRERVAERLRKGHAEGRLDLTEFQQRLERCYASKTIGELRQVVNDLPREEPDDARSGWPRSWRWRLAPLAPLLLGLIVLSALTGHQHHVSWLWIPLVFIVWRMSWWRRRRSFASHRRGPEDWI